jgi:hypothetical protein
MRPSILSSADNPWATTPRAVDPDRGTGDDGEPAIGQARREIPRHVGAVAGGRACAHHCDGLLAEPGEQAGATDPQRQWRCELALPGEGERRERPLWPLGVLGRDQPGAGGRSGIEIGRGPPDDPPGARLPRYRLAHPPVLHPLRRLHGTDLGDEPRECDGGRLGHPREVCPREQHVLRDLRRARGHLLGHAALRSRKKRAVSTSS